jgi:single-strand DNA-binding protein
MATNITILEGRLTRDVKFETTPNNTPVATMNLAVQQNFKDKNGERQADFIRVVAYRKLAELFSTYTRKGSHVNIIGRLTSRKFTTPEGEVRYITEVIAEQLSLLDSVSKNQQPQYKQTPPSSGQAMPMFTGQTTEINPEMFPPEPPLTDGNTPF